MRLSQGGAAALLVALAGGYELARDVALVAFALAGLHFPVPNCLVGSGPGC